MPGFASRLDRAQGLLVERAIDALLVGPSADLRWLIGYRALPLERLTLLVVPALGEPVLVVPELEEPRARASAAGDAVDIVSWGERENPLSSVRAVLESSRVATDGTFAVQDRLWSVFLLRLQDTFERARWTPAGPVTRELRVRKTPEEVVALGAAATAIDRVHERLPELLRPGRTEAEVGRDIAEHILEGHDEVNFVIVASGPNGASPHHETGERVLEEGDAIVVDIGGTREGYCSDMTRNYVIGDPPDGYREMHDVLRHAQRSGVNAVAPGTSAAAVDAACRDVLDAAGYGEHFVHRTGHGIGVEEHEHPYIVAGNDETLEEGMVFSVEPGVYLPARYGARIEDIVVVTDTGVERLNRLPTELTAASTAQVS